MYSNIVIRVIKSWRYIMNKLILVGRTGKDAEVTYSTAGKAIAKFSVATTEYYNKKETTTWHNVVAFGPTAEYIGRNMSKGDLVEITASLANNNWTDNKGQKRYDMSIVVNEFNIISKAKNKPSQPTKQASPNEPVMGKPVETNGINKDDIPF